MPLATIIGAGLAGLTCANQLRASGWEVRLLDKARGPGGRMASRRRDDGAIDHGAQYFTVRDPAFRQTVDAWTEAGVVAGWKPRLVHGAVGQLTSAEAGDLYVGTPRMSALTRHLAGDLSISTKHRATALTASDAGWQITTDDGSQIEAGDALVVAIPATQAADLLQGVHAFGDAAAGVRMEPCWALLAEFESPVDPGWDAWRGDLEGDAVIGWAARENTKPGRREREAWVVHATTAWTNAHLEMDPAEVAPLLLEAFAEAVGGVMPAAAMAAAHRWRFARPADGGLDVGHFWDAERALGVCGDWCLGPRVEFAWRSGRALAAAMTEA